ncbi:MAG TPA: DUF368 domain-containing protein [Clostridiaceae bacterium]|nr:DUF368 domain-containing protein [Clostridiaceae bacterium]
MNSKKSEIEILEDSGRTEIEIPEETGLTNWLLRLLKGVLIGIGAILPGLSGGVLAVIFGVYDHMMIFLGSITKNFLKRMRYFLPIGIGGILGIILFSVAVAYAFGAYEPIFVCLFLGFVVGTLPSLYKKAGSRGRGCKERLGLLLAMAAIIVIMHLGVLHLPQVQPGLLVWIGAGSLIGLGVIIPGLSTSNFLIYLGLYDVMAHGVKDLELTVIIPIMIGVIITILLLAKATTMLFKHHYSVIHHVIVGLVIGSSIAIVPTIVLPSLLPANLEIMNLSLPVAAGLCAVSFILGAFLSYQFSRVEKAYET